ncbi:hypothetical protein KBX06_27265 [Micromonospora sp. C31]|uniref:hypothetical protein n=1 Tax=Micromonospora sp. C31 TaxID=2824876 RepID=UPI001B37F8E6|nr:hypothetical protein [Micromonospora sp. C31]MBQ1076820.1 hypothetical protein [Micromonospora sp. C31]
MSTAEKDDQVVAERDTAPSASTSGTPLTQVRSMVTALAQSMWQQALDREREGWPPWWLPLFAVLLAAAILGLLIVPLIRVVLWWAGAGIAELAAWGHELAYARIILDPVRDYLASHAAGLPVSGNALWWTWCFAGVVLLLFSLFRSAGARIGWTLYGAGSAAMVAAGTGGPGRWIAAGICGLWWSLLSIPGLSRRRQRVLAVPVPAPPATPAQTVTAVPTPRVAGGLGLEQAADENDAPDDDATWAAGLYEVLIRREHQARPSTERWSATTHASNGFTAIAEDGRRAAGIAISGEAVRELLAGLSTPVGARPEVGWTTAPPAVPRDRRMDYDDLQEPGSIHEFVAGSPDILARLAGLLQERRSQWPVDLMQMQEKIIAKAATLDRASPLVRGASYSPEDRCHDDFGLVALNDWVATDTIVGGNASFWNDFASHRPQQVQLIIRKLLTAPDPGRALAEILTDDGHVHLTRYPGPAGPIHEITVNGTHRTHALRLLGVPLIAAEVTVQPLPLRLAVFSASATNGWGEGRHHGPTEALWRALIDRGLLTGRISGKGFQATLEPHQVTAPWLLCCPRDAAAISAAYDRLHPGALGIPAEAMSGPAQWCQWLLGDPCPTP